VQVSLQSLKAFESAARRGSFKLAAEELSLTPTAISHHVSNLENRLNIDLFHRTARQVVLTEAGRRLAKATSEGFRKIEGALEEMRLAGSVVRVTTTSSLAAMVLIPSLQEFSEANPAIHMEISTGEAVENQAHIIPIRFGDTAVVHASDIIRYESFDMFGAHRVKPPSWSTGPITVYTTEWKNSSLPDPPLAEWLTKNGLAWSNILVKKFDQELFGIQQAMSESGFVFCSTLLTTRLLKNNLLQKFGTNAVKSDLCYYVPNKKSFETRNAKLFLNWVEELINH